MIPIPRHHVYKKKKNYAPWIFACCIILAGVILHTQEKKIRLFLAGDIRQKIENQRVKIYQSFANNEPIEIFIRDYQIYTRNWLEIEPFHPEAHFFRAESYYLDLVMNGLKLDSSSLSESLLYPLDKTFLIAEKAKESSQAMFEFARRAEALDPDFDYTHHNQFLLFLGESLRGVLLSDVLWKEYSQLKLEDFEPLLSQHFHWLLLYHAIRSGNTKAYEEAILKPIQGNAIEREVSLWRGICLFHAKDYVQALPHLRAAKLDTFDTITKLAIFFEAKIFYIQNLPRKAIDLLVNAMKTNSIKENLYLTQLQEWSNEKKELKNLIPEFNE